MEVGVVPGVFLEEGVLEGPQTADRLWMKKNRFFGSRPKKKKIIAFEK